MVFFTTPESLSSVGVHVKKTAVSIRKKLLKIYENGYIIAEICYNKLRTKVNMFFQNREGTLMTQTATKEKERPVVRELLEIEKTSKSQDEVKVMLQEFQPFDFQVQNSIVFHPFF